MPLIQIHDMRPEQNVLAVNLRDVLSILDERALRSSWLIAETVYSREPIMVTGAEAADRLEELSRSGQWIGGDALQQLAQRVVQVIWGEFQAFEDQSQTPWAIIRAIDSSYYEIETEDEAALQRARQAFSDVREGQRNSILNFNNGP